MTPPDVSWVLPLLRDTSPLSQLNELIDNTSSVILHVDANQAKMKSSQAKPKCFRCWFKGAECQKGTISGSCICCGTGRKAIVRDFGSFFSEPLLACLSRIAASLLFALGSEDSYHNVLEIHNTTTSGLRHPHILEVYGDYDASKATLEPSIDEMVWTSYTSGIREKDSVTSLIRKAILVRGYLTWLFATSVTERLKVSRDGFYQYEPISGSDLGLHLTNFILFRLNTLVPEVMNAVIHRSYSSDNAYLLDVDAASAVLYTSLIDVCDGLTSGRLKPLCGDPELAALILRQIRSTAVQLEQHLDCNSNWAAHLKSPPDDLRSITMITNMVLTLECCFHDAPNLSPSSLSSLAVDDDGTPAPSTDEQITPNTEMDDFYVSPSFNWLPIAGEMPSSALDAPQFNFASGVSSKLPSKVSGSSDIKSLVNWPEQNNVICGAKPGPFR